MDKVHCLFLLLALIKPVFCTQVEDTPDEIWDLVIRTGNLIVNLTRPNLDNEIRQESLASFNKTILDPINSKLSEQSTEIKYDRASILLLTTDITSIKNSLRDMGNTTLTMNKRLGQLKTSVDLMNIRIEHVLNDTKHLKTKLNDLKTKVEDNERELHTLNDYVQGNSLKLQENSLKLQENSLKLHDNSLILKENSLKLHVNSLNIQNIQDVQNKNTEALGIIVDWIKKHNSTSI